MTLADLFSDGDPLTIQVPGYPYSTQRLAMDGRVFTIALKWNQDQERWYFSLFDAEDEPIAQSVCIVSNWPLLRYLKFDPRVPPGELMAQDLTGDGSPPGYEDFGTGKRVEFTYFAQTET